MNKAIALLSALLLLCPWSVRASEVFTVAAKGAVLIDADSGRVLFGTDLPWFSTMHGVGMVLSAEITDRDRENIFFRNGERLLANDPYFVPFEKGGPPFRTAAPC